MNINFIQTIITVLIFASATIPMIFGCTTDAAGAVDCSASWLPPSTAAIVVSGLAVLKFVLKYFQGGAPALVNKMVPVVPADQAKAGVVTEKQVQAPGTEKK